MTAGSVVLIEKHSRSNDHASVQVPEPFCHADLLRKGFFLDSVQKASPITLLYRYTGPAFPGARIHYYYHFDEQFPLDVARFYGGNTHNWQLGYESRCNELRGMLNQLDDVV